MHRRLLSHRNLYTVRKWLLVEDDFRRHVAS